MGEKSRVLCNKTLEEQFSARISRLGHWFKESDGIDWVKGFTLLLDTSLLARKKE